MTVLTTLLSPPERAAELERTGDANLYGGLSTHPIMKRAVHVRHALEKEPAHPLSNVAASTGTTLFLYKVLNADAILCGMVERLPKGMREAGMYANGKHPLLLLTKAFAVAVLLFGVLRLISGYVNDKPVLILMIMIVVYVAMLCVLLPTGISPHVRRILSDTARDTEKRMKPLEPGSPAFALGLPLAAAVGGAASLWTFDPVFANDMGIPVTSSGSGGSDSSCSSGGGCGGCGGD